MFIFFFQAEDGIRDSSVTGVQTCALPISCLSVRREIHSRSNPAAPAASPSPPDRSWLALTARPQDEIDHQAKGQNNQKSDRVGDPKSSQALSPRGVAQPNGPAPCSNFVREARH